VSAMTEKYVWSVAMAAFLLCRGAAVEASAAKSLGDLSGPWHLFVDDYLVAHKDNVTRTYHPFEKHAGNPVLNPDRPWEGRNAYVYGSVLPAEDGRGYRMWYHSWADGAYWILYATSEDGLHWDKPDLGLVSYKDSRQNNILLRRTHEDHNPQVIHTSWESEPARRYKLINYDYGRTPPGHIVRGYYGATSADGIHWTDVRRNPVLPDPGDVGCFVWDPFARHYVGFPKRVTTVRGQSRRCVGFSETPTFEFWPTSTLILVPDEFDDRWTQGGGQRTDFYGLCGFAYESMYLGFLWVFRITDGNNDGPIFVELVSSHDGVNWIRQEPPRTPILAPGDPNAWDRGMIFTTNHPLVEGKKVRLYYGGFDVTHGPDGRSAIGLATLRKDGFASLDAGAATGTVATRRLIGVREKLRVNCEAHGGWVKVEVLDESGQVVPGYGRDECDEFKGNSVDQVVTWKGSDRLPEIRGPLQFRFVLQNASLYSFALGGEVQVLTGDSGVLYTFEGDSGTTVIDRLTADGPQNARLHNKVAIESNKANAAFGGSSLRLEGGPGLNALRIPGMNNLGTEFTLSVMARTGNTGFTRLFTSYRGGGPPLDTEVIFDFDPSGKEVAGLHAVVHGEEVQSGPVKITNDRFHHFAMTYAGGDVSLYLDGEEVGSGHVPGGPVLSAYDLRFGEDARGAVVEQFAGFADDILVLRRALKPDEIKTLGKQGGETFLAGTAPVQRTVRPSRPAHFDMSVPPLSLDIGSRLELFVDSYLIDKLDGTSLRLHSPRPAEVAIRFDRPWEGNHAGYCTVIKDGDTYRLYYRGLPGTGDVDGTDAETTCYAESSDGVRWTKPNLGLFAVNGTRENNVVLAGMKPCSHNFSPFIDTRPDTPLSERYKALGGLAPGGLHAFVSPDGIHWKRLQDKPVVTSGAFDSQNVAFWSKTENCYVCYLRTWTNGVRWISRATSKDFLKWSAPVAMDFGGAPPEHLYTNQTSPYYRAPHIYVATAARFMPGRRVLSDDRLRTIGVDLKSWLKDDCSEVVLLSSRGSRRYERTFMEGFVRPGLGDTNWVSRTNYPALGIVQTGPTEMSMYVQRDNGQPSHHLRRYTMRIDGFASINAPYRGGEMVTRQLAFAGKELIINYATSAAGGIRVEIQDENDKAIPGYVLADCAEVIGDQIERVVSWKAGSDLSKLAGRPVRLRFVMKDADLYSLRFR
jgi:hypothetical protein